MLKDLLGRAEEAAFDLDLFHVRKWKGAEEGRRAIGYMPIYAPV